MPASRQSHTPHRRGRARPDGRPVDRSRHKPRHPKQLAPVVVEQSQKPNGFMGMYDRDRRSRNSPRRDEAIAEIVRDDEAAG